MKDKRAREKNREKAAYWNAHIKGWKESGLKQIDYCIKNNLSRHRFTYWKSKDNKKSKPLKFIPVISRPATQSNIDTDTSPLKVLICDKYRIEVGDRFSRDTLSRLINTLEAIQ